MLLQQTIQRPALPKKPAVEETSSDPLATEKTQASKAAPMYAPPANEKSAPSSEESQESSSQKALETLRSLSTQEDNRRLTMNLNVKASSETGIKAYQQSIIPQ